jgi:hypothetical protein
MSRSGLGVAVETGGGWIGQHARSCLPRPETCVCSIYHLCLLLFTTMTVHHGSEPVTNAATLQLYFAICVTFNDTYCNTHARLPPLPMKQITTELLNSHVYLQMSTFFARDDVSLLGLSSYFNKSSHEERSHADLLVRLCACREH